MESHIYVAIDLKSFYASVECKDHVLDPMTTNLVVADASRTEKTICLAVSPSLKAYGIPGRARLFEVIQKIRKVNQERLKAAPGHRFTGKSCNDTELKNNPSLAVGYHIAPPRMARYIEVSTAIYQTYLKYFSPEDMHVYSIDEIFIDITHYMKIYQMSAYQLTQKIILDILDTHGLTAAAGIGTNLYLCKIAMDIVAKHVEPDENGVRIAQLDEMEYRRLLWEHEPITDFWRIGRGYARKLAENGMKTMGDVARCSVGGPNDYHNEELLYKLFGINAELLIDHAWVWEPCTIAEIKSYKPENNSICSGQVLQCPYTFEKTRIVVREMAEMMALDLVDKGMVTDQMVLTVGYDIENLSDPVIRKAYTGEITIDRHGRSVPKHAHGTQNLSEFTNSTYEIIENILKLYDRIINRDLLIRRITLTANHIKKEQDIVQKETYEQLDLFTDYASVEKENQEKEEKLQKEKKLQHAMLEIKKKYGKNAILKGTNFEEGATSIDRNQRIGGHKA